MWKLQSSWYAIVTSFPYSLVVCKLIAFHYWPELPTASQENIERVPPIGRHLQSLYKKTFVQYKKNETPNKKELTPEARAILAANMTLEYEFYQFVKKRLRLQKRSIGLMGKFMRNFIPSQTFIWTLRGRHQLGGIYKVFTRRRSFQYKKNETPYKKELTPEARSILAANMTLEYEFYQFVKECLGLPKRSTGLMGKFMRNLIPSQTLIWTQNAISFQHFWVLKNPVCQIEKTAIWKDAQNSLDWRKLTAFQNAAFDFPRVFSQKKQWTILCRKLWFWCRTFLLSFKN